MNQDRSPIHVAQSRAVHSKVIYVPRTYPLYTGYEVSMAIRDGVERAIIISVLMALR